MQICDKDHIAVCYSNGECPVCQYIRFLGISEIKRLQLEDQLLEKDSQISQLEAELYKTQGESIPLSKG